MKKNANIRPITVSTALLAIITFLSIVRAFAVGGAAFTTVNEENDGPDHCLMGNPPINCSIYDGKEYVWLNGGPDANDLKPDGYYFFAVLEPSGQKNPNDRGGILDNNLSDDFDTYVNRTFGIADGEIFEYTGTHYFASQFIRLFPYSDSSNPGGIYILAICYIGLDGSEYPVDPQDCKYDYFTVMAARDG